MGGRSGDRGQLPETFFTPTLAYRNHTHAKRQSATEAHTGASFGRGQGGHREVAEQEGRGVASRKYMKKKYKEILPLS